MLLTVDIGNTNVVMGLMPTRGELASQLRFPTDKRRTVREFMDGFEALVAMHGFDFSLMWRARLFLPSCPSSRNRSWLRFARKRISSRLW